VTTLARANTGINAQYAQRNLGWRTSMIATTVCTLMRPFIAAAVQWPSSA
jgi:hypothetical protein